MVELSGLGSTGSSIEGRSATVLSQTSLPTLDRQGFLAGGRFDPAASALWTGDHSALKDPAVPWGLLLRA